jgi:tRNA A37 threonylcarbamoyltransferase TsaD
MKEFMTTKPALQKAVNKMLQKEEIITIMKTFERINVINKQGVGKNQTLQKKTQNDRNCYIFCNNDSE